MTEASYFFAGFCLIKSETQKGFCYYIKDNTDINKEDSMLSYTAR